VQRLIQSKAEEATYSSVLADIVRVGDHAGVRAFAAGYRSSVDVEDIAYLLLQATGNGHIKIVETLLKVFKISVHTTGNYQNQAIHIAVIKGHKAIVELLLRYGANINARNGSECTPLHFAPAYRGNKEMTELLAAAGADPTIKDDADHTPFECALQNKNQDAAMYLLDKFGADIIIPAACAGL
jgi:ankyrin repeat protein